MPPVLIRPLSASDAPLYQSLRLRALREAPETFGSTFEEDSALAIEVVEERLTHTRSMPARAVIGAWQGSTLVGFVGAFQLPKVKTRHTAMIWGTYVAPEMRGHGVGRQLLDALLAEVKVWPGVTRLTLSVVERAPAARRLYEAVGFTEFGREPDAFRQADVRDTALHLVLAI